MPGQPKKTGLDARNILYDAISFVRSTEENKVISGLTLDALLQPFINSLQSSIPTAIVDSKGESVGNRISKYDSLTAIKTNIDNLVKAIQKAGTDPTKLEALGLAPIIQKSPVP